MTALSVLFKAHRFSTKAFVAIRLSHVVEIQFGILHIVGQVNRHM